MYLTGDEQQSPVESSARGSERSERRRRDSIALIFEYTGRTTKSSSRPHLALRLHLDRLIMSALKVEGSLGSRRTLTVASTFLILRLKISLPLSSSA